MRAPSPKGRFAPALAVAFAAAAVGGCSRMPLSQRCAMVDETLVAEGWGSYIRAVALEKRHGRLMAAWTDAAGTVVQSLTREGRPIGEALRVAPPAASIDLASLRDGFALATLHRGSVLWGGGRAELLRLDPQGRPRGPATKLGRAGAYSEQVSVATVQGSPVVAWEDGTPGDPSVRIWREGMGERRLSPEGVSGCCPHVVAAEEEAILAYGEYTVPGPESRVLLRRLAPEGRLSDPVKIAAGHVAKSHPAILQEKGQTHLVYRDRREGERESLFYSRFAPSGERLLSPVRIGRYDGSSRAVLMRVGAVLAAVEVRSWAREWIVALDRFSSDGVRFGAQYHVFADWIRLTAVDAVPFGTRYLLLYSEDNPDQRVWLGEVSCR